MADTQTGGDTSTVDGAPLSPVVTAALIAVTSLLGIAFGSSIAGVNAVVLALVFGLVIANVGPRRNLHDTVVDVVLGPWLKTSIVLLGAGVNLSLLSSIAGPVLAIIAVSVAIGLASAFVIGSKLRIGRRPSILIGVGTSICGASAIAAVAPIIGAKRDEMALALGTVFTFNAAALILYPILGTWMGLDQTLFGAWAGIGVHDTATSVATGFAYGDVAGEIATLTKLTRTLFLIPLILFLGSRASVLRPEGSEGPKPRVGIPWFIVGFVAFAIANTMGVLGSVGDVFNDIAKYAIVAVVAATALSLRLADVTRLGRDVAITGVAASLAVGVVSLAALLVFLSVGAT